MEAFHYRYHPLAERMRGIVASGELGRIKRIQTWICLPILFPGDIRYRLELGGGATMDVGCYAIHMQRLLAGQEPTVESATARMASPGVDRYMRAEFRYPDGSQGTMTCSMASSSLIRIEARVQGDRGEMRVCNPLGPQIFHRLRVRTENGKRTEKYPRISTYVYQLRAFARAVQHGESVLTGPDDAVANMRVIDAVYEKAGLSPRGI